MPLQTIIMILAIPIAIVILFNLDFHKGDDTPEDDHPSDESAH